MILKVVVLSDTHNKHNEIKVPDGDLILHAGDATMMGTLAEISIFAQWYGSLPHPAKIFVAGNHDFGFEKSNEDRETALGMLEGNGIIYLEDGSHQFKGVTVYGSPWQPMFGPWAFNLERGHQLRQKWQLIPAGTDIVITHGPPLGIGDRTTRTGENVGCRDLRDEIANRIKPRVHIFGHIHEAASMLQKNGVLYVNASNLNLQYNYTNKPVCIEYDTETREVT
jgi:Icc-related predicted phosphoesterase